MKFSISLNKRDNFAVSANQAYSEMRLERRHRGESYKEPDMVVRSDQGCYELTEHPVTTDSPPAAPVYETVKGCREE